MLITGMPLVMWSVDWKSNVHEKGRVSSWKSRPDGRATCFDFIILSWLLSFPEWRYRPQFPSISRRPTSLSTLPLPRVIISSFPCSLPRTISLHTVLRTLLWIAYSDERWLYYRFSLPNSYVSLEKFRRMYFLDLEVKVLIDFRNEIIAMPSVLVEVASTRLRVT